MKRRTRIAVAGAVLLSAIALPVLAGEPFRQEIPLAAHADGATSGPVALTLPKYKRAVKVNHILYSTGAGVTNTFQVVTGSISNTVGTKATSDTDRLQAITNGLWVFQLNDRILLTSSATNAATAVLVGEVH